MGWSGGVWACRVLVVVLTSVALCAGGRAPTLEWFVGRWEGEVLETQDEKTGVWTTAPLVVEFASVDGQVTGTCFSPSATDRLNLALAIEAASSTSGRLLARPSTAPPTDPFAPLLSIDFAPVSPLPHPTSAVSTGEWRWQERGADGELRSGLGTGVVEVAEAKGEMNVVLTRPHSEAKVVVTLRRPKAPKSALQKYGTIAAAALLFIGMKYLMRRSAIQRRAEDRALRRAQRRAPQAQPTPKAPPQPKQQPQQQPPPPSNEGKKRKKAKVQ